MTRSTTDLELRPSVAADRPAVLDLLSATLPWVPDELFGRFFSWKHEQNPFGPSPSWVAVDGSHVVGFRTFVRWEFDHPDGRVRRAVRAVDTATHPDYQGRGVFSRATRHGLDELARDGTDFVFNTPNEKSRPGYLKMGWTVVGRLAAAVRPSGPTALVRIARSRVPADRWSEPDAGGDPAAEVLGGGELAGLINSLGAPVGLRTRLSPEYLRWRYGFPELAYRAVAIDDDPARGVAVFRVRRRGASREAALCQLLVEEGDPARARHLARRVARVARADYVIRLDRGLIDSAGFVRLPRQGPILTWRGVAQTDVPALGAWDLSLGDIELF